MATQTTPTAPRDNLLGICHTLGETFGFNPLFLRVALLLVVLVNAEAALIAYFAAGAAVLVAKLATRNRPAKRAKRSTRALIHA